MSFAFICRQCNRPFAARSRTRKYCSYACVALARQGPTPRDEANERARFTERHPRGDTHPQAKLRTADIPAILDRVQRGESQQAVARSFAVSPACIQAVVAGRTWRHARTTEAVLCGP